MNGVEGGRFGYLHATSLLNATKDLDATITAKVEAKVLERAPTQTVSEFRAALRRAVARLDPRGEEEQHEDAVAQRRVCHQPDMSMRWPGSTPTCPQTTRKRC